MLGCELQLPLDRLRPTGRETPGTTPFPGDRVQQQQRNMKQRFDNKHRVKRSTLTVSDWVRIRRPSRSHKLLSFWSAPQQITAQLGAATYRLMDGSRWHASRLRRVMPPLNPNQAAMEDLHPADGGWDTRDAPPGTPTGCPPPEAVAPAEAPLFEPRPVRVRQRPPYLKDYVTDL